MEIKIKSEKELPEAAAKFLKAAEGATVIAFDAPMGVGKTTFISALCGILGVKDDVSSPTFSIVNEYVGDSGRLIYHFDCYRLENIGEALDMGAEDYLESGNLCLIEWPGVIAPLLPTDTLCVSIREEIDGTRILSIKD